ncbi:glycosyltransferase family 2 protein [Desertivirga brevis]|uniref:glycosyltransferase family 2 protein n=1 Tax=Desertivirga brevis TaxID=2810310 RepID=UPI001A959C33|nr:glycosyltransferase family 2 protein [Pedobacter sp. SYSU D00873]
MDISIIIPTFNRLWILPQAVNSCMGSKLSIEIIVVDDGSTDGTGEWLASQENIVRMTQSNWGKCWAVNAAFKIAQGKYIKFLDSDDMVAPGSLEEQFELAEQDNCDVVVSGYSLVDEKNEITLSQPWIECDDFIAQQLGESDSSHYSAYLFKKTFIEDIPHRPDFAFRDDRLFVLEVALKKPKVSVAKINGLLHRHHKNERLQFNNKLQAAVQNYQHINIYKKILNTLDKQSELTKRRINASSKILMPLIHWIAKDNLLEAEEAYNWLLKLNPENIKGENKATDLLYKVIGFKRTEQLFKIRRIFKYGLN